MSYELLQAFAEIVPAQGPWTWLDRAEINGRRGTLIADTVAKMPRCILAARAFTYNSRYGERTGLNFYVKVGSPVAGAPVLDAHYDIANPRSQNVQDNTASVVNLLQLAARPDFNGWLSFTDTEELVYLPDSGVKRLVEDMREASFFGQKAHGVLSLELTARGSEVWADQPGIRGSTFLRCPCNNAVFARQMGAPAACIGTLPAANLTNPGPVWHVCHSEVDNLAQANLTDMAKFQEALVVYGSLPWAEICAL